MGAWVCVYVCEVTMNGSLEKARAHEPYLFSDNSAAVSDAGSNGAAASLAVEDVR